MSESKEESNSKSPDVKEEESSSKAEETKTLDESSKDSEKDSVKDNSLKEESEKDESEKEESEDEDEEMGLLDRPVEVTGCRARKKVERLEYSATAPKEKFEEGKGQKLGNCPRIEHQIQKTSNDKLKILHRVLFSRVGPANQIKKNIKKFSGFPFGKSSHEFERKKTAVEKLSMALLKQLCEVLDLERGGSKEDVLMRILEFLLNPKDSGKSVESKKKPSGKEKKKVSEKKAKNDKPKTKKEVSSDEEPDSANESASDEVSDKKDSDDDDESDVDSKKKSKTASKAKKTPSKAAAKKSEKKEKPLKEEKKKAVKSTKRKRDDDSNDSSDDEPSAKKSKIPTDDEIKKLVKRILDAADLQEITMKKVIKQVADAYPDCDLSHKKAFIKTTIKSVIS